MTNKSKKVMPVLLTILALGLLLGVLVLRPLSDATTAKWPVLRIGYLPLAAELPLFVGVEQGYFEKAGVKVELIRFASSNDMGNAATAGKIDILAGAASNVIFDIGYVSGKKHLLFALNPYSNTPGHITDHLLVRKNSDIRTLTDLKGKTLASFPGSANRTLIYLILQKHGVPHDSYNYIELLPKDWEPSLQTGTIDAVSALEPNASQIMKDSVGISIFPGFYADLMPDIPLSGHWIAADFYAKADKSQISAFLNAYEKAIRFCRDNETVARTYLPKYANVREDILADVNLNPWKHLSEIDRKQFQTYINLLAENHALLEKVNISDYILPDSGR